MLSIYGQKIAAICNEIDAILTGQLGLKTPFQPDPTEPGQRFGICDYQDWQSQGDEFEYQEQVKVSLWVVAGFASYTTLRDGMVQITADLRSLLPTLKSLVNDQGILLNLGYPPSLPATKQASITVPNNPNGHLWIGSLVVPLTLEVSIPKTMLGAHLQ
jgi:hypothetical protein